MIHETARCVNILLTLINDTKLSNYWDPLDERVVRTRCLAEGLEFLTVSLPKLGKALERAFACGYLTEVDGFKRVKGQAYPYFLRKAWETLFHPSQDGGITNYLVCYDGNQSQTCNPVMSLFADHDYTDAVLAVRQISLMFYKVKLPYTPDQISSVQEAFLASEDELTDLDLSEAATKTVLRGNFILPWRVERYRPETVDTLLTRAAMLVKRLLAGSDPFDIVPQHGSGASACRTSPWKRYKRPRFIPKLNDVYPYIDWFYLSGGVDALRESEDIESLPVESRPLARVVFVPKDSRGPRLISTEPREFMYIQQGLMAKLYATIERYPAIRAQLDCTDQTRNQFLARVGSSTGSLSTLDLKEASDRVSLTLVRRLFPPNWLRAMEACRSEGTVFPDGTSVSFRKFAPMGSAICFPVEAICFWAITLAATVADANYQRRLFSDALQHSELNQFAVFGDDIICPTQSVNNVIEALELVGLKVNKDKSYWSGPFRESCGADFFLGEDVSIVRCRELPYAETNNRSSDCRARFRTIDWFNNLIVRYGSYRLADSLLLLYEQWYGEVCVTTNVVAAPNEYSKESVPSRGLMLAGYTRKIPESFWDWSGVMPGRRGRRGPRYRWNQNLNRFEVWTMIEAPVRISIDADDWSHLLRTLLGKGGREGAGSWTLAKRCNYKYGWVAI